jgi:hypothetical protein
MSFKPWADAADLRAENQLHKTELAEVAKELEHQRTVARVFHDTNHKLNADIYIARCNLAAAKAKMHRRDPATGRLLPKGK